MLLLLASVIAACGSEGDSETDVATPQSTAAPKTDATKKTSSVPFDLDAIVKRVELGFREIESGSFVGGSMSYRASVSEQRLVLGGANEHASYEVALESLAMGRGTPDPVRHAGVHVEDDGHLVLDRGIGTEHLTNTEDGLEQRFRFGRKPAGQGDLEVRLRVVGLPYAGQSPEGHHFRDADGLFELRYGNATWIDAGGNTTSIEVRHLDGGELALVVPQDVVESSSFPAEIDPLISVLSDMGVPAYGYARADQVNAKIASNGNGYLVVWQDARALQAWAPRTMATRLDINGNVLDPGGFQVSIYGSPDVVSNGTDYLVVTISNGSIRGNRVSASGGVFDGQGQPMGTTFSGVTEVSAAYGGGKYLITYASDIGYTADIVGRLYSTSLSLNTILTLSNAFNNQSSPRASFDGTLFLVVWQDLRNSGYDIYGCRVTLAGAMLDPQGIQISATAGDERRVAIASDGTGFFVAWDSTLSAIMGARVDSNGTVLDPAGLTLGTEESQAVGVDHDGSNYVVAWTGSFSEVKINRVDATGAVLDGTGTAITTAMSASHAAVACSGAQCAVVWDDLRAGDREVFGRRVQNGAALDSADIHISPAANEQLTPSSTFGNGVYMVVWDDRRTGIDRNIYGSRVGSSGSVLDAPGFPIAATSLDEVRPRVAASTSGFLVVWEQDTSPQVHAARLSATGTVLDPSSIVLDTYSAIYPTAASDGTDYLVVWRGGQDLVAKRVDAAGSVLDATPIELRSNVYNAAPAVAFGAGEYFVVAETTSGALTGFRVLPDGTVLDASPGISLPFGRDPAVTYDGSNFVVAFRRYDSSVTGYRPWAARVNASGTLLDSNGILLNSTIVSPSVNFFFPGPQVAFDGEDTIIVWPKDMQNVYATWLSPTGGVFPTYQIASDAIGGRVHSPTVAAQGDRAHTLVSYVVGDTAPGVQAYRLRNAYLSAGSPGIACTDASTCKFYSCVDGFCCDSACGGLNQTDCLACSAALTGGTDGYCAVIPAGFACRAGSGDMCDSGAVCDGIGGACPTSNIMPANSVCRSGSSDVCDPDEYCTGLANDPCPVDVVAPSSTVCRPGSGDACDPDELCPGTAGGSCPADILQPSTTVCRTGSGDACDPDELCPGTPGGGCPADTVQPASTVCRAGSGDTCDPDELCPGTSGSPCPTDTVQPASTVCRAGSGDLCDPDELCPGTSGSPCPTDTVQPASTVCRTGSGDMCDPDELCPGTPAAACPTDVVEPASTVCRSGSGDLCDPDEQCTGNPGSPCPGDAKAAAGTTCRASLDACDAEEQCSGDGSPCPSDAGAADGTVCDDGDLCTSTDACVSGACVGAEPVSCVAPDECHSAGTCSSDTGACISSALADGTPCSLGTCQGGACVPDGPKPTGPSATPADGDDSTSDTGCGCHMPGRSGSRNWSLAFLMFAPMVLRHRRRRVRSTARTRRKRPAGKVGRRPARPARDRGSG